MVDFEHGQWPWAKRSEHPLKLEKARKQIHP
jgi:hypothetical protein